MYELRERAETLINKYEEKMASGGEDEMVIEKLKKLYLIEKIIAKGNPFFEMSLEQAISILKELEIEDVKEKYKELISKENYKAATKE